VNRLFLSIIAATTLLFGIGPAAAQIDITKTTLQNGMFELEWNGGTSPWTVESHSSLTDTSGWTVVTTVNTQRVMLPAAADRQFFRVASTPPSPDATARYRMTFVNSWSTTNPAGFNFPSTAHYTSFIGASHNDDYSMWKVGELASPGMELVAELGGTGIAENEILAAIGAGSADTPIGFSGFFPPAVNQTTVEFDVNLTHTKISFASMVAPSPDWFVGVSALDLLAANGDWVEILSVPANVYDAGTETGAGFDLSNPAESPHKPITRYAPFTMPFGAFTFERID